MKTSKQILFSIFTLVLLLNLNVSAQTPEQQKEMEAYMKYMTPGDIHKILATSNGDWTSEVTMWFSPDAPPVKSTGKVNNKMILDGRYQYSTHSGNMMGMPFEGISITGYDNGKDAFVVSWIDNFGTGILNMEGKFDPATNTVTLTGKQYDPVLGVDCDIREIFTMVDANTQTIEMFMTKQGKEMKTMELKLTR